jgi:endonuclease YncB( thermonuclease family)
VLLARWARQRLEELVRSPEVRIDLVACGAAPRDRDGRRCGVLYADGRDIASTMIREGLAHPYICENDHCPARQPWCTE